jgi:acid-sensing ion channel, other
MDNLKVEETKDPRRLSNYSISNVSECETKRNIKYGGPLTAAWGLFSDFANNSTVHGVKYLGERRRHWAERFFWIVAFFISVVGCSILIHKLYVKWETSPVIVSFAEKSTPVWEIPFPAVTICPETKVLKEHCDFTKAYKYIYNTSGEYESSPHEIRVLESIAQVCDPHLFAMNGVTIKGGLKPEEIVPLLKNVSVPMNESILLCKWRNSMQGCDSFFTEIITEEGFCYTFNVLKSDELFNQDV